MLCVEHTVVVCLPLFVKLLELRPWSASLANNEKPPDLQSREPAMSKNATRGGRGGGIRPVVRAGPSTANVPVPSSTGIYYGGVNDTTGKTVEYSVRRGVLDA